jgi:hypothetical protein
MTKQELINQALTVNSSQAPIVQPDFLEIMRQLAILNKK